MDYVGNKTSHASSYSSSMMLQLDNERRLGSLAQRGPFTFSIPPTPDPPANITVTHQGSSVPPPSCPCDGGTGVASNEHCISDSAGSGFKENYPPTGFQYCSKCDNADYIVKDRPFDPEAAAAGTGGSNVTLSAVFINGTDALPAKTHRPCVLAKECKCSKGTPMSRTAIDVQKCNEFPDREQCLSCDNPKMFMIVSMVYNETKTGNVTTKTNPQVSNSGNVSDQNQ